MNADERRRTQMKRGVERSFFRFNTEFRGADSVARHASFVIAGSCRLQVPQTKGYADAPDATNASDRLRAVETTPRAECRLARGADPLHQEHSKHPQSPPSVGPTRRLQSLISDDAESHYAALPSISR